MTGCEDPGSAAPDAYISAHLDKAADARASHIDTRVRQEMIREAGRKNETHDGAAAAEG